MIRLLIFILSVVFFAAAATILLTLGQRVSVEAFGWKMDAPAGVAGAFIALFFAAFGLLVSLYKDFTGMRRRRVLRGVLRRREKGVAALVEAAQAHARAEYPKAAKHARKASKLLDRDDVAVLFAAPPPAPDVTLETIPDDIEIEVELEPGGAEPEEAAAPSPALPEPPPPAALPSPAAPTAGPPDTPDPEESLDRDAAAARRVN